MNRRRTVITNVCIILFSFIAITAFPVFFPIGNKLGSTEAGINKGSLSSTPESIPNWEDIDLANITIDQISTPEPLVNDTDGVNITIINRTFVPERTKNASNKDPVIGLRYIERVNITCFDTSIESGYTVEYYPSLANRTNYNHVKISNASRSWTFTQENNSIIQTKIVFFYQTSEDRFLMNISTAVRELENSTLYENASYLVEIEYTYNITLSPWIFESTSNGLIIDGVQENLTANYSTSFKILSEKSINMTLLFKPKSGDLYFNDSLYVDGNLDEPYSIAYNGSIGGFRINPGGGFIQANGTEIEIKFSMNMSVQFTNIYNQLWSQDEFIEGYNKRRRIFDLEITEGPEEYLLENVNFNLTTFNYSNAIPSQMYSDPETGLSIQQNDYQIYDSEKEEFVSIENGTTVKVSRLQKSVGISRVGFNYIAQFGARIRVLDEARNPLIRASVELDYFGKDFGVLMANDGFIAFPSKLSNNLGEVYYNNLPEGNYSLKVLYQGEVVKVQNFTLGETNQISNFDIVTIVPYPPLYLISWIAAFAIITIVGLGLIKKKKN